MSHDRTKFLVVGLAGVSYPDGDHLFAIGWDGLSPEFEAMSQPIVDSLGVPTRYSSN